MAPTRSAQSKILSLEQLSVRRREAAQAGLIVAHCHGCFDIVHPGHIRHLEFAARLADILLVSITVDQQIHKGAGRPFIPDHLRAENLAALNCVDWVVIDPNSTAVDLLERVRPDVYVKGREYESNRDPRFIAEKAAVERHGGRVVFSSGDVVFSSTALIEQMEREFDPFSRRLQQLAESHDLSPGSLESIASRFADQRVVVIGESILDRYVLCRRPEIASEAPVMTLHPMDERTFDGGSAIICQHLVSLGAEVELVTALPANDASAQRLIDRLQARGVNVRFIETDEPIVVKERYLVGRRKVMKVDRGQALTLDETRRERLVEMAHAAAAADESSGRAAADAVVLCDYGFGLLTPATLDRLIRHLRPEVRLTVGNVSGRRSNLMRMKSLDLLCPSEAQLRDATGDFAEGLNAVVWKWLDATNVRQALVTLGEEGVVAFARLPDVDDEQGWRQRLSSEHVPALGPAPIDELGCGDALLATVTLALAAGADLVAAAYLGSLAAAIEGRELGNVPGNLMALRREWRRLGTRRLHVATAAV